MLTGFSVLCCFTYTQGILKVCLDQTWSKSFAQCDFIQVSPKMQIAATMHTHKLKIFSLTKTFGWRNVTNAYQRWDLLNITENQKWSLQSLLYRDRRKGSETLGLSSENMYLFLHSSYRLYFQYPHWLLRSRYSLRVWSEHTFITTGQILT